MPQHDKSLIKARAGQLRADVAKARNNWLAELVGKPLHVLAESDGTGYAENFARVAVPPGTARGTILTITPRSLTQGLLT